MRLYRDIFNCSQHSFLTFKLVTYFRIVIEAIDTAVIHSLLKCFCCVLVKKYFTALFLL